MDFPKPNLGSDITPSQFENEQKLPKKVHIIPNKFYEGQSKQFETANFNLKWWSSFNSSHF